MYIITFPNFIVVSSHEEKAWVEEFLSLSNCYSVKIDIPILTAQNSKMGSGNEIQHYSLC